MPKKKSNLPKFNFKEIFLTYDKSFLIALLGLAFFGLLAVFNSSVVLGFRDFNNQYHFIADQAVYLLFGLILTVLVSRIDYHHWYKLAVPFLVITIILLVAVFIPGIGIKAYGAKRWINLGIFRLQPTELAKLALVIYLSAWFSYKEKGRFLPFLVLVGIVVALIVLQPDLGTAIIITLIAGVLYFVSGAPLMHFGILLPLILVGIVILTVIAPYRMTRLMTFINPDMDPLGSSYHIRQILIALGSGGWLGLGLGKSRQKYEYLPEANTDSIFAVISEEIGFVGSCILIFGFMFLIYRAYLIARRAPDRFGQLLGTGVATWIAVQTIINLSSMVALLPLTGVPLPLISYGGSNLISLLIGIGVLLNINTQNIELKKLHKIT